LGSKGGWAGLVGPRQQHGMARAWLWVRAHARGAWLPRAAAWPCRARGTGIPGPRHDAAAGKATAVAGACSGATGSCKRSGTAAGGERETLRFLQRAHRLGRQQRGRKRAAAVVLTGGAEGERAGAVAGRGRRVVAVQEEPQRRWSRSGRRLGEGPVRRRWSRPRAPPRAALLLLLLSSRFSSCGGGGKA
jgi:hypothetical protein